MRPQYRQPGPVPESWNDLIKRLGGYLAPPLAVVAAHITAQVWGVKWRDGSCSRRGTSLLMVDLLGFWGTSGSFGSSPCIRPPLCFAKCQPYPTKKSNRSFCRLGNQLAVLLLLKKKKRWAVERVYQEQSINSSKRVAGQPRSFRKWALQPAWRFIRLVHHMLPGPGNSSATTPENGKGVNVRTAQFTLGLSENNWLIH